MSIQYRLLSGSDGSSRSTGHEDQILTDLIFSFIPFFKMLFEVYLGPVLDLSGFGTEIESARYTIHTS